MGDNIYEMINMTTHQMTKLLNPSIENFTTIYQTLATYMDRVGHVLGTPIYGVSNNAMKNNSISE